MSQDRAGMKKGILNNKLSKRAGRERSALYSKKHFHDLKMHIC